MLTTLLFLFTAFAEPLISEAQNAEESKDQDRPAFRLKVTNNSDPVSALLMRSPLSTETMHSLVLASDNLNTYTALLAWKQQNPQAFRINVKSVTPPATPQQLMEANACVALIVGDVLSKQPPPVLNLYNCGEHHSGSTSTTLRSTQSTNGELSLLTKKDDQWTVVNNKGRPIDAKTYGTIAKDAVVLLKVEQELSAQRITTTSLTIGSGVLLLSAVIPLSTGDTSQSSIAEDRAWTSLFLVGSAAMLYTARSIPKRYVTDRQSELSNYTSKEKVSEIIAGLSNEPLLEEKSNPAEIKQAETGKTLSESEPPVDDTTSERPPTEAENSTEVTEENRKQEDKNATESQEQPASSGKE